MVAGTRERVVAAFDFDGTLSSRDNFLRFIRVVAGRAAMARALVAAVPPMAAARRDPSRRDDAKAVVLRKTLAGQRESHLQDLGARFARGIIAHHLHPEVVARLDAHRAAGHELVLVSASLRYYLDPAAARLGIAAVLATEMALAGDGRLTGEIAGANVRGPEKVARLDAWLAVGGPATVYAYGDSDGDAELLARADHAFRIDRRGRVPGGAPIAAGGATAPR